MASSNHVNDSYEVRLTLFKARGKADKDYYYAIYNKLKIGLRKSGRFPRATFACKSKDKVILVSNVSKKDLEKELLLRQKTARDHGYSFTYELSISKATPGEILEKEVENLEDVIKDLKSQLKKTEKNLEKGKEELAKTQKVLEKKEQECITLEGRINLLGSRENSNVEIQTRIQNVDVYPSEALANLMGVYSPNIDLLDMLFEPTGYKYSIDKFLKIGGMDIFDFVNKEYGSLIARAVKSKFKRFSRCPKLSEEEARDVEEAIEIYEGASAFSRAVDLFRRSRVKTPCMVAPAGKQGASVSVYIPRVKVAKGPVSKYLYNVVKDVLLTISGCKLSSNRHEFAREFILRPTKYSSLNAFASEVSEKLETVNKKLPKKIGYALHIINV